MRFQHLCTTQLAQEEDFLQRGNDTPGHSGGTHRLHTRMYTRVHKRMHMRMHMRMHTRMHTRDVCSGVHKRMHMGGECSGCGGAWWVRWMRRVQGFGAVGDCGSRIVRLAEYVWSLHLGV